MGIDIENPRVGEITDNAGLFEELTGSRSFERFVFGIDMTAGCQPPVQTPMVNHEQVVVGKDVCAHGEVARIESVTRQRVLWSLRQGAHQGAGGFFFRQGFVGGQLLEQPKSTADEIIQVSLA